LPWKTGCPTGRTISFPGRAYRRREIDCRTPHRKLEPGVGQRRSYPVPRLLHRRIRQTDDDDHGIPPAAIDLHLDRGGFNPIDRSGQNTRQHGRMLSQRGRKGSPVFGHEAESGARMDLLPTGPDQKLQSKNLELATICGTFFSCC
jgi:hypothetical protein